MATRVVDTSSTFENWRQRYNDLATDVGSIGNLVTGDKSSVVNAINYLQDQYFFFQDFDYDGSDGATSNTVFSGADNAGNTLQYMASKVLVYKNGLLLRSGTDYTAVNGTSVTLTSSANNGDVIRISSYTGSYTATPSGQESNYIWSTAGGVIHNRNDAGIVFNSTSTTDTTLDVANSFQFNGPVYAVEDVYINNQNIKFLIVVLIVEPKLLKGPSINFLTVTGKSLNIFNIGSTIVSLKLNFSHHLLMFSQAFAGSVIRSAKASKVVLKTLAASSVFINPKERKSMKPPIPPANFSTRVAPPSSLPNISSAFDHPLRNE